MSDHYDIVIIGAGEAAKYLSTTYSSRGKRCAVIERSMIMGSCPTVACLPSKNFLYSAHVAHLATLAKSFGISQPASGPSDMKAVRDKKDKMRQNLKEAILGLYGNSGVELIMGEASFTGQKELKVTNPEGSARNITAETVIINTGSFARLPDTPGLSESKPLTHVELLDLDELPKHLIVLGGGYVGLEFAQAMRRFGSEVTVIDRNKEILKNEDEDVSALLHQLLEKEGIKFALLTSINQVSGRSGDSVTLNCTQDGKSIDIKGSHILAATGRIPNTSNMGLSAAGIETNKAGHITIDEACRTSAAGVFAVGDCTGPPYFTHTSLDDFRIVRDALDGKDAGTTTTTRRSGRQVPSTLFTDPELAQIGLREKEAKAQGIEYRLSKLPMGAFLRMNTMEEGATAGFAKVLVSTQDDQILGFTALGPHAGEFLPVVQMCMKKGLSYREIAELIFVHPTLSEGLMEVMMAVPERK